MDSDYYKSINLKNTVFRGLGGKRDIEYKKGFFVVMGEICLN